jgi:hypothetical protein
MSDASKNKAPLSKSAIAWIVGGTFSARLKKTGSTVAVGVGIVATVLIIIAVRKKTESSTSSSSVISSSSSSSIEVPLVFVLKRQVFTGFYPMHKTTLQDRTLQDRTLQDRMAINPSETRSVEFQEETKPEDSLRDFTPFESLDAESESLAEFL